MPRQEKTAATSKDSKGAGRGNVPQALNKIGHYLSLDSGHGRREQIQNLFFAALESEGLNDTSERGGMLLLYRSLIELDAAVETIYGDGRGLYSEE